MSTGRLMESFRRATIARTFASLSARREADLEAPTTRSCALSSVKPRLARELLKFSSDRVWLSTRPATASNVVEPVRVPGGRQPSTPVIPTIVNSDNATMRRRKSVSSIVIVQRLTGNLTKQISVRVATYLGFSLRLSAKNLRAPLWFIQPTVPLTAEANPMLRRGPQRI